MLKEILDMDFWINVYHIETFGCKWYKLNSNWLKQIKLLTDKSEKYR